MRKILLATTALVGFAAAGAAQAATTSPLNVTVGGSVDFLAGAYNETKGVTNGKTNADFETLYSLEFGVTGKAANGLEYGGNLVMNNVPGASDYFAAKTNSVTVKKADVFVSGVFGKIQVGDFRGATDMAVTAPTVGAGQVTGRYIDFLDSGTYAKQLVVGIDGTDHSTNATYYTPKFGNDMHKVQAAVTYTPNFEDVGNSVTNTKTSTYKNMIKGVVAYDGTFNKVSTSVSANVISGASSEKTNNTNDFMSWGVGAKAAYNGFTLGATYTDLGNFNKTFGDSKKDQEVYTAGLTYEINKPAVGASYLGGTARNAYATAGTITRVKSLNTYGVGGAYTWAPGLTTNVDGILFNQKDDTKGKNAGYVLLLSQKLAF